MVNNLKAIRINRRMTQARLAEITGISRININRYENQEINPGLESVIKIARALGVTVDELIRPEPDTPEAPERAMLTGVETPERPQLLTPNS